MSMPRMIVLGVAVLAAIAAIFLMRGLMGGGTSKAQANLPPPTPSMEVAQVLVTSQPLQPGQPLNPTVVHWQKWPKAGIDSSFITQDQTPDLAAALNGTVVRAPMVEGEPITTAKFVHGDSAGFLAATLQPGMRAVSIPVTTESGAGGFILPNDRIDLLMVEQISDTPKRVTARIILSNIRVLAMDQTYKQDKDQKVVLAKTATLELTPDQARLVTMAQAAGPLSLALRPLGDNTPGPSALTRPANDNNDDQAPAGGPVRVIRFGVTSSGAPSGRKE